MRYPRSRDPWYYHLIVAILFVLMLAIIIGLGIGYLMLLGWLWQWAWNTLLVPIFGLPELGFWQGVALAFIFSAIFGRLFRVKVDVRSNH